MGDVKASSFKGVLLRITYSAYTNVFMGVFNQPGKSVLVFRKSLNIIRSRLKTFICPLLLLKSPWNHYLNTFDIPWQQLENNDKY